MADAATVKSNAEDSGTTCSPLLEKTSEVDDEALLSPNAKPIKSNAVDVDGGTTSSPPEGTAEVDDIDEALLSPNAKPTSAFAELITSSSEGEEAITTADDDGDDDGADCAANITPHPPTKRTADLITSSSEGEEMTIIADGDGADCAANITPHPPTKRTADLITSSSEGEEAITTAGDDGDDDGADCAANIIKPITPHPPAKRVSRRLEAARRDQEEKSKRTKKAKNMEDDACEDGEDGTSPQCEASKADEEDRNHTNGYFEVDDILDRRTHKYGSDSAGLRHVVQYLVSWKVPADYDGDASYYDPSWLIAENLDQNSLASAFRKFPMDGDPDREIVRMQQIEMDAKGVAVDECLDLGDYFSDDEEKEMEEDSEDEDDETTDIMQEYDVEEQSDKSAKVVKDPDVSCLEESGELYHMQAKYCKHLSGYMLILLDAFFFHRLRFSRNSRARPQPKDVPRRSVFFQRSGQEIHIHNRHDPAHASQGNMLQIYAY